MSDTDTTDTDGIDFDDEVTVHERMRHRNGDETVVLVTAIADGYQALALDVDAGGQLLEVEIIGDSPEQSKAVGMASYWCDQNPEGVLGDDGGGIMDSLLGGGS